MKKIICLCLSITMMFTVCFSDLSYVYADNELIQSSDISQVSANVAVEKITLNYSEYELEKGQSFVLKAKCYPENAANKNIKWTSSNEDVALVTEEGRVTVFKSGEATITAKTSNGKTATCKITSPVVGNPNIIRLKDYIMNHNNRVKINVSDTDYVVFLYDRLLEYTSISYHHTIIENGYNMGMHTISFKIFDEELYLLNPLYISTIYSYNSNSYNPVKFNTYVYMNPSKIKKNTQFSFSIESSKNCNKTSAKEMSNLLAQAAFICWDSLLLKYVGINLADLGFTSYSKPSGNGEPYVGGNGFLFTDVNESKWYYKTVKEAYAYGLMSGTDKTTFSPDDNMTRGMIVSVLHRIAGTPKVSYTGKFKDVSKSSYCVTAVEWAAKNKVVSGYSNGKFGPNDNITRQDVAVILYNYAKNKKINITNNVNLSKFKDYKNVSGYAKEAMKWAVSVGIMSGSTKDGKTYLNPKANATRAECAKMLLVASKIYK